MLVSSRNAGATAHRPRSASVALLSAVTVLAGRRLRPDRGALPIILAGGALDMLANLLNLLAVRQGLPSPAGTVR